MESATNEMGYVYLLEILTPKESFVRQQCSSFLFEEATATLKLFADGGQLLAVYAGVLSVRILNRHRLATYTDVHDAEVRLAGQINSLNERLIEAQRMVGNLLSLWEGHETTAETETPKDEQEGVREATDPHPSLNGD